MDQKKIDQTNILNLTEKQAKSELYCALTIIRKVIKTVPVKKRKQSDSYNKQGHMKCVNYLHGFINVWEQHHGS